MSPERPPARGASFYLERRRLEATGGLAARVRCERRIEGMRSLLQPGLTLLVDEQLGSCEAPEPVGDPVCEASEAGQDVALGLSIPRTEQERIDTHLLALGSPLEQDELLRGAFSRSPHLDGRASGAVVDLMDRVRAPAALPYSALANTATCRSAPEKGSR